MKIEIFYPLTDDLCFKHIFSKEEVLEEFNKSVSYITRIFLGQLERGKKYLDAKKVIGLNFISVRRFLKFFFGIYEFRESNVEGKSKYPI